MNKNRDCQTFATGLAPDTGLDTRYRPRHQGVNIYSVWYIDEASSPRHPPHKVDQLVSFHFSVYKRLTSVECFTNKLC
jgi:hypothetical protein